MKKNNTDKPAAEKNEEEKEEEDYDDNDDWRKKEGNDECSGINLSLVQKALLGLKLKSNHKNFS